MTTPVHLTDRCIVCEHPISGVSPRALEAAGDDHRHFIWIERDHRTDPHFLDDRLTALMIN